MYGSAMQNAKIIKSEDGEYIKGVLPLCVVRSDRYTGDSDKMLKQDIPLIFSDKPEIIAEMDKVQQNDMIYIKGVIVTKPSLKITTCPECGKEQSKQGMIVYIYPIYFEIREHGLTQKESVEMLYKHREISNEVLVIGNLCMNPIKVSALKKTAISEYQIAIPRTYRIDEEKTDYPWVKSYGSNAEEDMKRLQSGSTILIDGCIQARSIVRKSKCEECGKEYEWRDSAMEVVPYETEYLANFITDDDIDMKDFANN